ncbi:MAG TPA: BamA/TamA family outer membrane protein [Steroidobacteraceae bacterium]|nr:BamA/TamA family outer membrane protein [Steroidobacteraceae bacterium]
MPSLTARSTRLDTARPPEVPDDATLEASGATIGHIQFNALQLFDIGGLDQDTALFRLANRLHIRTREATIADQLLFREGQPYDPSTIAETARILRSTRYLRDASIRPVAYHDGVVDLEVKTQDVWTLNPGLSFGRHGGKNTGGFELEELNFLGLGTEMGLSFKSGIDRDSKSVFYRDRQLGSSWWDLSTAYSDNSDGRLADFSLERPFYSFETTRAGGVAANDDLRVDSRYDLGKVIDKFETHAKLASAYFGFSHGLSNGWARRYSLGFTYDDHQFADAPGAAPAVLLPADRKLVYPWFAAEWVQDRYATTRNRDQIEKTEDYSLGWKLRAQVGFASSAAGSDRDAVMLEAKASTGYDLTERQSLSLSADAAGRVEGGSLENGLLGAEARYYFRQSPRRLFFMGLTGTAGTHLDTDTQLLLGGDNGLRGYPLRYQAGTGRWLFTAEQRGYSNWFPFQLFNVGGAVFFDVGRVTGRDPLGSVPQGVLKDVGIGLRLGNSRSALGNVLHIDLAFPLDGDSSIDKMQVVVETKRSF